MLSDTKSTGVFSTTATSRNSSAELHCAKADVLAEIAAASAQQRREIERVGETVHRIDHTSQQQALFREGVFVLTSLQVGVRYEPNLPCLVP